MAQSFEEAVDFDGQTGMRARRSEALLRQLYHEEVNPKFRVPRMRGVKLLLLASLVTLIAFGVSLLLQYNHFITLRETVYAAQGNLEGAVQRRANLFSNMIKLTLSHAELEHAVFSYAALKRSQMGAGQEGVPAGANGARQADGAALLGAGTAAAVAGGNASPLSAESLATEGAQGPAVAALAGAADMQSSLGRLMAIAERYPDVRSSETYHKMMDALMNIEDLISERRREMHASMLTYNAAIQDWPWSMLADVTGFERARYFEADAAADATPVLTPEIAQELKPVWEIDAQQKEAP